MRLLSYAQGITQGADSDARRTGMIGGAGRDPKTMTIRKNATLSHHQMEVKRKKKRGEELISTFKASRCSAAAIVKRIHQDDVGWEKRGQRDVECPGEG